MWFRKSDWIVLAVATVLDVAIFGVILGWWR